MKAQNKFKEPVLKEKSSYKTAVDALIGTGIVFIISGVLALLSYKVALVFILFCILYTVMLMRFTQQKNN